MIYFNRRYFCLFIITLLVITVILGGGYWWVNSKKTVYLPTSVEPVYRGNADEKEVALTVNVFWGEEYIPQMLDIMRDNKVKSTFFMGGQWVEKFPDLTKKIYQEGHELGSHGYSHPHVDQLSKSQNIIELEKTEDLIFKATGERPTLFAPPYGERSQVVLESASEAGYRTILWSVDTVDWQRPEPKIIEDRVLKKVHNGAIVLMHPTAPTIKALPNIINGLKEQGYNVVTVSELLKKKTDTNK